MLHPTDERVMFTLPAGDQAIIGTTETPTSPGTRDSRASREDVEYLLSAANSYFPAAKLTEADVISAWSGIRPLAQQLSSGDVGSASREHTISRGPRGVIHVTGGKLTTYREMASQVVDQFAGPEAKHDRTAILALPGGERLLDDVRREASEIIEDPAVCEHLVLSYGTRWRDVWALGDSAPRLLDRVSSTHGVIGAEFAFAARRELAMTLGDVLIRRTHLAFEMADQARSLAPAAAEMVSSSLGWDEADREVALRDYDDELSRTFGAV
jgi:glycerol-3-phosphate dehydrogenase